MDARTLTQQNYDKLDRMADMIEPLGEILTDQEAAREIQARRYTTAAKLMLKNHKQATVAFLAAFEGVPEDEYEIDGMALVIKLLMRFNELQDVINALFPSRAQNAGGASSGPVTENTEGVAQ